MKDVYQISDLASRKILDQGAEKPARLAVIGYPVAHSASPAMHQAALDALDVDARYIRLEVKPGQVAEAIDRMKELEFIGCNVTVPHKLEVIDSCDDLSEDARALGAVNTLLLGDQVLGHNTDAPGLVRAIHEDFGIDLADLKVMIVGVGGGAGRAVATQCSRIGCDQLWLVNRTLEKAEDLAQHLRVFSDQAQHLEGPGEKLYAMTPDDPSIVEAAGHADLIINATSLGLKSFDPLPLTRGCVQPHHLVYDMIYNPPSTPLIKHAQSMGARTSNGLSMLLHQGALAYECWFPGTNPLTHMKRGLLSPL
ncbi:MAG: shikimate dehydrogenase [Verrucomicrobiae bacterium]|nr:shikimate dehydrogenase [Verrucomicrobiae bacterium]NNJ43766.1 shikimate dehydrogenase [Akkermansiaceae bacterium]